jgi:hypothetical protein
MAASEETYEEIPWEGELSSGSILTGWMFAIVPIERYKERWCWFLTRFAATDESASLSNYAMISDKLVQLQEKLERDTKK